MAKCPICGGTGNTTNNIPPTNEQWFCSLSTEEKAEWLENKMMFAAKEQGTFTAKGWETWLKEKHESEGK